MCDLVARDLAIDDALCNTFEVDASGNHTGRAGGPLCYGAGKLTLAEQYAGRNGESLAGSAFYTDSYSDLPTLAAVGRPVAVNPDLRLRGAALRRGWPVVDWGRGRSLPT